MPDKRPLIAVSGPDRGGFTAWLMTAWAIRRAGGRPVRLTFTDCRVYMAGEFAGIVRVSAPEDRIEALTAALQGLDRGGLRIQVARGAGSEPAADTRALRMELVGHDFYLFLDEESGQPSVVYRRRGYSYGLIRLEGAAAPVAS